MFVLLNDQAMELFTEYAAVKDLRGVNVTYTEDKRIWKHGGTGKKDEGGVERSSTELKDNNWIVYRLADIYLMKAEALIMSGDLKGGYDLVVEKSVPGQDIPSIRILPRTNIQCFLS